MSGSSSQKPETNIENPTSEIHSNTLCIDVLKDIPNRFEETMKQFFTEMGELDTVEKFLENIVIPVAATFQDFNPQTVDKRLFRGKVINKMETWIVPSNPPLTATIGGTLFDKCYDIWYPQQGEQKSKKIIPIEEMLKKIGKNPKETVLNKMKRFNINSVVRAEKEENYNLAAELYSDFSKVITTTKQSHLKEDIGLVVNGFLEWNPSLTICFDKDCRPGILKRITKEESDRLVELGKKLGLFEGKTSDTTFLWNKKGRDNHIVDFIVLEETIHCNQEDDPAQKEFSHIMLMPFYRITLLSRTTDKTRLDQDLVKKLISQMLIALDFLHQHNYGHSDIKPANICISGKGNFILIDLGSTKPFGEKTDVTDAYLPVEMKKTKIANKQVDFWMLAFTVGEVIKGEKLEFYSGLNMKKEQLKIILEKYPDACGDLLKKLEY